MPIALAVALFGLALLDSTSIGTLFIPVWLLLTPGRVRAGRFAVYLATIVAFYFLLGVLIALGAGAAFKGLAKVAGDTNNTSPRMVQFAIGAVLFAWSFRLGSKKRRSDGEKPGRILRWRERAMSGGGSAGALMALAVLAASLEAAMILPYLGAIGLMTTADLGWATTGVYLAAYCRVMVLPAVVLIAARLLAHQKIDPLLQRLNMWMVKYSSEAVTWMVGGIGGYLFFNALAVIYLRLTIKLRPSGSTQLH